ncbi:hypothetical protein VaNZ11_016427 [Volvox africanus]|uniref:DWNN domain-containing protein n=1 Tax=Volvox africanus TaxID=51714 RepID=A0ABQ5SMS6_9CHLO|nr:hypothetical protein VaNZ11_016427 [Volvox africanus]
MIAISSIASFRSVRLRADTYEQTRTRGTTYDALVKFARGTEVRFLAGQDDPKPVPRANAVQAQDPTDEGVTNDHDLGVVRPTTAATVMCTERRRCARGGSGTGARGSGGAGPSSGPDKSKKRGGAPSAAAVQNSHPRAKRMRTEDPFLPKWDCKRSELERRKTANVCWRCTADHLTKDCPLLPPLAM